jgi:carbamoyl-phosphate synthase small subunit
MLGLQTAPHIGNTGVNREDDESDRIRVAGYVVRDPSRTASSWRATGQLADRLAAEGVVGIAGVDTRALTRHLRERGAMRVGVSSLDPDPVGLLERVRATSPMLGADLSAEVTTPAAYTVPADGAHRYTVAALDLGIKRNVTRRLAARGVTTHVLPAWSTLDDLLAVRPDAAFFSPGPGCRCSGSASAARCSAGRSASTPTSSGTGTGGSTSRCRIWPPARWR